MLFPSCALNASIEAIEPRFLLAADVLPPPTREFLSDLTPSYVMNGFGAIGINRSNGEETDDDGKWMRLNGRRYDKGIGVHSYSELRYALNGEFRSFVADVGVDDEVGTSGSVSFQVFADGTKLFDSGVMTGRSAFKRVNVDIAGRDVLTLIVRDGGDGTESDHADWAGAHLRRHIGALPQIDLPRRITLDEPNSTFRANAAFTDSASNGPWTTTVDWGDGSGIKRIDASDDETGKSMALRHKFDPAFPGTYNVSVHVSNGLATGVATCQVTVNNTAPSHVALSGADDEGRLFTTAGFEWVGYGTFEDPGKLAEESYTYRVNFGDGSPVETGDVPARLFFVNHTFASAGTYTIAMSITDEAGNVGSGINTIVVTEPVPTFLSDLTPMRTTDDIVRDANSRNGGDIKLNGRRYDKGLGVRAVSDVTYDLSAGRYRALQTDIGVDDYGNGESSVIFRVFTDGNEIFNSGAMNNESETQQLNLDITGAQTLRLLVADATGGAAVGFADWAGIRII